MLRCLRIPRRPFVCLFLGFSRKKSCEPYRYPRPPPPSSSHLVFFARVAVCTCASVGYKAMALEARRLGSPLLVPGLLDMFPAVFLSSRSFSSPGRLGSGGSQKSERDQVIRYGDGRGSGGSERGFEKGGVRRYACGVSHGFTRIRSSDRRVPFGGDRRLRVSTRSGIGD